MKRTFVIIAILFSISSQYVSAQAVQEYSAYLGGGFSPLSYQLTGDANRSGGFGGNLGVGYTYYFDVIERVTNAGEVQRLQWGIHSGLGLGFYTAKSNISKGETTQTLKDEYNHDLVFKTSLSGYTESQTAMYLTIPVMAHLHIAEQFYAKGGLKAGIPLNGKFSAKNVRIDTKGTYTGINPEPLVDVPFAGFSSEVHNPKGNFDLGFAAMLALEGGMRFRITTDLTVYAGLFFDIGLNNSLKKSSSSFVDYVKPSGEQPAKLTTNSVLTDYTDKARIMAVGVKVSIGMTR